jgi:hypothetical protein
MHCWAVADSRASSDSQDDLDDAETLAAQLDGENEDDFVELHMLEQLQREHEDGTLLQAHSEIRPCPCANALHSSTNIQTLQQHAPYICIYAFVCSSLTIAVYQIEAQLGSDD